MTVALKAKMKNVANHTLASLSPLPINSTASLLLLLRISLLFALLSVAVEQGHRHSWEGKIRTGRWAFPHTSSRQSDWLGWWYRLRGSPVRPRSLDQSRTVPYSSAAQGLRKHTRREIIGKEEISNSNNSEVLSDSEAAAHMKLVIYNRVNTPLV